MLDGWLLCISNGLYFVLYSSMVMRPSSKNSFNCSNLFFKSLPFVEVEGVVWIVVLISDLEAVDSFVLLGVDDIFALLVFSNAFFSNLSNSAL